MSERQPEQEIPRMEEGIAQLDKDIKRSEGAVQRRREVVGEDFPAGDWEETHDEAGGEDPEGAGKRKED
jgi:hypothetical protein